MAVDAFLQFTQHGNAIKVAGETKDAFAARPPNGGPAAFEITKWNFGASNAATISSATGGAGGGKAEFDSFSVTKNMDIASPALFLTSCLGGHYQLVTLWVRKSGSNPNSAGSPYLEWQFKLVFVESINWSSGDEQPTEDIKFKYGAIQFTYSAQQKDGTLKKAGMTSWSQILNSEDFDVGA